MLASVVRIIYWQCIVGSSLIGLWMAIFEKTRREWWWGIPSPWCSDDKNPRNERIRTILLWKFWNKKKSSRKKKLELPKSHRVLKISGNPEIFVQEISDFPSKTVPKSLKSWKSFFESSFWVIIFEESLQK